MEKDIINIDHETNVNVNTREKVGGAWQTRSHLFPAKQKEEINSESSLCLFQPETRWKEMYFH